MSETRRVLEEGNAELEAIVRGMRRKFWPTEGEMEAQAWMEVEEERAETPPLPERPRGHRWQDVLRVNWKRWRSKHRRRQP